jgi:hypothetical protein
VEDSSGADAARAQLEEMRKRSLKIAREAFERADTDNSGSLDAEEIWVLANQLGHQMTKRQARAAVRGMDNDGNGEVDFEEFYEWWSKGEVATGPDEADMVYATAGAATHEPVNVMDMFRMRLDENETDSSDGYESDELDAEHAAIDDKRFSMDTEAVNPFGQTVLNSSVLNQSPQKLRREFEDYTISTIRDENTQADKTSLHGPQARDEFFRIYHLRREGRLEDGETTKASVQITRSPNRRREGPEAQGGPDSLTFHHAEGDAPTERGLRADPASGEVAPHVDREVLEAMRKKIGEVGRSLSYTGAHAGTRIDAFHDVKTGKQFKSFRRRQKAAPPLTIAHLQTIWPDLPVGQLERLVKETHGNVEAAADYLLWDGKIRREPCTRSHNHAESGPATDKVDTPRRAYLEACLKQGIAPKPVIIAKQTTNASHMSFRNYCLGDNMAKALAETLRLLPASVKSVDLSHNDLHDSSAEVISKLANNQQLTCLDLSNNSIDRDGIIAFSQCLYENRLPNLEVLSLGSNIIGDKNTKQLVDALLAAPNVHTIDLSRNEVGIHGGLALGDMLAGSINLTCLDLSWNSIRTKGAKAIGEALAENGSLKTLDLSWNCFGDAGAEIIGHSLGSNTVLQKLDLSHNRIGERGAMVLGGGLKSHPSLTALHLNDNPIGMRGGRAILSALRDDSKNIVDVFLNGCDLSSMDSSALLFDREKPDGKYKLDLSEPYDHAVMAELLDLAKTHGSEIWVKPRINRKEFVFDAKTWEPPKKAPVDADGDVVVSIEELQAALARNSKQNGGPILEVQIKVPVKELPTGTDVVDADSFDRLKSLLFRMNGSKDKHARTSNDAGNKAAVIDLASKEFFFSADQVKDVLSTFQESDDGEIMSVLANMFDRTVDQHNLEQVLKKLTSKQRDMFKAQLGNLYFFDRQNPTGHYILNLGLKDDKQIVERLVSISNAEGMLRSELGLGNVSQTGAWDSFRNERLDGNELKKKLVFKVPTTGILEFDFVACFLREQCRNTATPAPHVPSDYEFNEMLKILPTRPEPSEVKSFHNLRIQLKPYLFAVDQTMQILQKVGSHPDVQVEAFIVLFGKIIDLRNMYKIFSHVFNNAQRQALFDRLGVLNVWSPLFAIGTYNFSMGNADERIAADTLLALEYDQPGAWQEVKWMRRNTPADQLTAQWAKAVPKKGKLELTYGLLDMSNANWKRRHVMVEQTLAGDEMRRPELATTFDREAVEVESRRLVSQLETWKKVRGGKAKVLSLVAGGIANLMKSGPSAQEQQSALVIQKYYLRTRGKNTTAATVIQALFRGKKSRVHERERCITDREDAASRIQARCRGNRERGLGEITTRKILRAFRTLEADWMGGALELGDRQRLKLAKLFVPQHYAVETTLVEEGEDIEKFVVIDKGLVAVSVGSTLSHRMGAGLVRRILASESGAHVPWSRALLTWPYL